MRRRAAAILNRFNQDELGNTIEVLVALLDVWDGDPDLQEGDEDGQCSEDEISTNLHARYGEGAGCVISDGDSEQDGREVDDGL